MRCTRTIEYVVQYPERPAFDPRENALADLVAGHQVLVAIDDALPSAITTAIRNYAEQRLSGATCVPFSGSEHSKRWETVEAFCKMAMSLTFPRDGAFVAVGGGVVLDAVGFAASIYRRGVHYIRIPTSLVAMIDTSVGIKQAINFNDKKNAIGSFYPALGSINDRRFLATLPRRHLSCGLAESLKLSLIRDCHLFGIIEEHGPRLLASGFAYPDSVAEELLWRSTTGMIEELRGNLFEDDRRRLVDLGHTFSPMLESESDFELRHGEAVALDMLFSASLAATVGVCASELVERLCALYRSIELPTWSALFDVDRLEYALHDARAQRAGSLNLVVPTEFGKATFLQQVSRRDLRRALRHLAAITGH